MDNITHTLVGLMLARTGFEKATIRGAGMMMLAANIPDLDAVTWFDRITYLELHRGYTHAFALAPVMALLPMAMARVTFSWKSYAASVLAVLSHLLLDWTNPYGIQLYLPFSARRTMLDITSVIDPWIWLILAIAVAAPALAGLVGSDMKGRFVGGPRRAWAMTALVALLAYEGLRFASHERAIAILEAHLYDGVPPKLALAVPVGINPFVWRGIVRTGEAVGSNTVRILPVNVSGVFDPAAGRLFYESPLGIAMDAVRQRHDFQVLQRFSSAQFWSTSKKDSGTEVVLMDLRFGDPGSPSFAQVSAVIP